MATKKHLSINDLPNELFAAIFRLLYAMNRKTIRKSPTLEESWEGDPLDPSMFPFAQAKVCKRWCALLANRPIYWTRIPVIVGPTPLQDVVNYFGWSQGLSVEVALKCYPDTEDMQDDDFELRVAPVLAHVSRNLHRITKIYISLVSTPDVSHSFVELTNMLTSSRHTLVVDAPLPSHDCNSNRQDNGDQRFSMPELTSLTIDSQTFIRVCTVNRAWLANAPKLRDLSFIPPEICSPVGRLSTEVMIDALSYIKQAISISIRGIHFVDDCSESLGFSSFFRASSMMFEDLGSSSMVAITEANQEVLRHLTVKSCSVLDFEDFFVNGSLSLEDLGEDCDLTKTFTNLGVDHTIFHRCAAFNDAFLFFMSDSGCTGRDFPARGMRSLTLIECTDFSVEALYDMILTRRMAKEEDLGLGGTMEDLASDDLDDLGAIMRLEVTGGPFLSPEYRTKFEQVVPEFIWTSSEDNANDAT